MIQRRPIPIGCGGAMIQSCAHPEHIEVSMPRPLTGNVPVHSYHEDEKTRRKTLRTVNYVSSLARNHTEGAIRVLAGIMNEEQCPPLARIAAAKALLERGWGPPTVPEDAAISDRSLQKVVHEIVYAKGALEKSVENADYEVIDI